MDRYRRRSIAAVALVSAALLALTACGDEPPQISTEPGDQNEDAPSPTENDDAPAPTESAADAGHAAATPPSGRDLVATCGAVRFDELPADPSSFPPLSDDHADDIDLSVTGGEGDLFFDTQDWYVASETEDELSLFGIPHEPDVEGPPYANAGFRRDGDTWIPTGWGQCDVSVDAPGWGNARFILDPDVEPDPEARHIAVQAWEMECASGEAPEGREIRPVVISEDEATVSVVILVEPVTGGAECPSNPSFPLEIELAAPLGDRTVRDASVDPALGRPWPPTESSLMSNGAEE